jgi:hypothetical protein
MRRTPRQTKEQWAFKLPVKGAFARRFYDHDGSLGGGMITIGADQLDWIDGLIAGGRFDASELRDLRQIADVLREGGTIDMWFEV